MWARRLGVPQSWPSIIKVTITSLFTGAIGVSIYFYMWEATASTLQLHSPQTEKVLCLSSWPQRPAMISWANMEEWVHWRTLTLTTQDWIEDFGCEVPGVSDSSCSALRISPTSFNQPVALAMSFGLGPRFDVLAVWAELFLGFTVAISVGVLVHDLALVIQGREAVLDVSGVNQEFPVISAAWTFLAGHRPMRELLKTARRHQGLHGFLATASFVVLLPLVVIWNVVLFNVVMVPLALGLFLTSPVKMSRAMVFGISVACSLYGVALMLQEAVFMLSPESRPVYALTWIPDTNATRLRGGAPGQRTCTCGCDYASGVTMNSYLLLIGAVSTFKCVLLALRCLKGLRRSQWANLLSVTFAVPLGAWPISWHQPNGQPIKYRTEDGKVQSEVAFDPFALMDEQPNSSLTMVTLKPESNYSTAHARKVSDPPEPVRYLEVSSPSEDCDERGEYIGCCGFPWPRAGSRASSRDALRLGGSSQTLGKVSLEEDDCEKRLQAHEECSLEDADPELPCSSQQGPPPSETFVSLLCVPEEPESPTRRSPKSGTGF